MRDCMAEVGWVREGGCAAVRQSVSLPPSPCMEMEPAASHASDGFREKKREPLGNHQSDQPRSRSCVKSHFNISHDYA